MSENNKNGGPKKLLGYPLTSKQDALINYLVPSIGSCSLYILIIATDIALIHRHFQEENEVWGWMTMCFMFVPVIGSFVIIMSSYELWPDMESCSKKNLVWCFYKTIQHICFPIWGLWRFAERIFWSVEAYAAKDEEDRKSSCSHVLAPRTIEMYIFLQAFLHSLPQILFQLHLLIRHTHSGDQETAYAQFLSIGFNLAKLSITVTYYQRFKSQKLAGSQYPWYKPYKYQFDPSLNEVTLRKKTAGVPMLPVKNTRVTSGTSKPEEEDLYEPVTNRRSSDLYLEPDIRGTYLPPYSSKTPSSLTSSLRKSLKFRETYTSQATSNDSSQPDFNIRRVIFIKGLPEDDLAGKLTSFCWWMGFLLARVLAISAFQYFYPTQILYILVSHFVLTLALLCYDAKSDQVTRSKAVFFIFVSYIYLFCIIEFKIKFKKAKFIYYGFFGLVYLENLVMCLVWWCGDLETIEKDFWFRYIFYFIVFFSICSLASMIFYLRVNKPKKVVVGRVML